MSYVPSSIFYLDWPSPLMDHSVSFDPFAGAELSGDEVLLHLASGRKLQAEFSVPLEGVLRMRVGESLEAEQTSPLILPGLNHTPAQFDLDGDVLMVSGHGVRASLKPGTGITFDSWREPPLLSTARGASGAMLSADEHLGWMLMTSLDAGAQVYGGGESFQGPGLRGRMRRVVNCETHTYAGLDTTYINAPFFWSDAGWGVFFHTSGPSRADLAATHSETCAFSIEGPQLDAFFFTGDPASILRRYHEITGRPGAFPDWGLGVWMSRCSYMSANEIDQVVGELQEADCPVDVIHVDGWVSGNVIRDLSCNWEIDRARFPHGWAKRLIDRGVRTSLWHNPYVLEGTGLARDLRDQGLLVLMPDGSAAVTTDKQDRNLIDFTNPAAVSWWKERVKEVARTEGNHSFKPDFGEEVPEEARFFDGRRGRELRNEYALLYQRATHEALMELSPGEQVALFCRSGTSGSQRYPCHWVGDTPSTWTGLVTALRGCLSLSLSGFGVVGHDVGGFFDPVGFDFDRLVEAFDVMDPSHFEPEVDPELFARWSQWGAFSPVMRFHGTGRREPTAYPEPARSISIEACRLRRRLRDYLVEAAGISAAEGTPMMRPMVLAFPTDRAARDAELQYLLGPHVLVAPILEPGGKRTFYVPEGRWRGLAGLNDIEGPGWASVECRLDQFPAFIRDSAPWPLA